MNHITLCKLNKSKFVTYTIVITCYKPDHSLRYISNKFNTLYRYKQITLLYKKRLNKLSHNLYKPLYKRINIGNI